MKKFTKGLLFIFTLCLCLTAGRSLSYAVTATSQAGTVITKSTALNLRSAPSASSAKVSSLEKGSKITLLEKQGDWWKTEYSKGKTAYAHSDYIRVDSSEVMYVATSEGNLNVRKTASMKGEIDTALPKNTIVLRTAKGESWSRILYNGNKVGFVLSKYLSETKATEAYRKLSLTVPSYKQTDTRWASVKIGTQGDTIGSSGCTTTALAMTESFHLNKTVTPKTMAGTLKYSSSGMLYWPTEYATELVTNSNYLKKVYSLLSKGKPVILGMKKSNGSQHWVVITGHKTASSSLSSKNFTINDPGSKTRTLLSDFVSAYPNAYKIAYRK